MLCALALAAVALADGAARRGEGWGDSVFWASTLGCAAVFAYRLSAPRIARVERLTLLVVFGLWLYLVKVLRDPAGFTYADELVHSYNVDRIVVTHRLFAANPILPLTPRYPGLEALTAAIRELGGTTTFVAGLVLIALARLLLMLSLFLLFEFVSGSARVAGLAALVYTANANFLFFSAQFSYESLALPLAVFTAYGVVRWMRAAEAVGPPSRRITLGPEWPWGVVIVVVSSAIVMTHHLTTYALVAFVAVVARAQREIRRLWKTYATPFPFAVFGFVAAVLWLFFVARSTWQYLGPVFSDAIDSAFATFQGHAATRTLFSGGDAAVATPLLDRAFALSSAAIAAVGMPFGIYRVWKHHRSDAAYVALAVGAAAYVGSLALRFVPAAWEIANRASEFLFIGLALALAIAGLDRWRPAFAPEAGRIAVAVAFAVLFAGGVVAGWTPSLRLAQPVDVSVPGATIRPQGYAAAAWTRKFLGPQRRFAADASNARLLGAYGNEFALAGTNPDVEAVIHEPKLEGWHVRLLRANAIQYVLSDRRRVSEDALAGYFFANAQSPASWRSTFPYRAIHKFDRQPAASKLFDSGNIAIYDVRRLVAPRAR